MCIIHSFIKIASYDPFKIMQKNTLVIPFIPNLLRLLYLLMRTKITMRKTQPKPARQTAIDIYRKKAIKQSIEFKELQSFDFFRQKEHLTPNESSSGLFASSSGVGATGNRKDVARLKEAKWWVLLLITKTNTNIFVNCNNPEMSILNKN